MFQPKHMGDEHRGIGELDELMQGALLTLRIMQRASKADMPRMRAKFREQLVVIAERGMKLADEFSR